MYVPVHTVSVDRQQRDKIDTIKLNNDACIVHISIESVCNCVKLTNLREKCVFNLRKR